MFIIAQIHEAHSKVKSGADFSKYIQEIKALGVIGFETFVFDSHTEYFGLENFKTESEPMYANLDINDNTNKAEFIERLKKYQRGETDYFTFCKTVPKQELKNG